jgi:hypothetical protein
VAAVLAVLPACGPGLEARGERSKIATYQRYRTYAWVAPAAPARSTAETDASLLDWRLRRSVDRALAAKGYARTEEAATLLLEHEGPTPDGRIGLRLVDARTGEMAYRAWATGLAAEPDQTRIDEAVDRMLADLPHVMVPGTAR